MDICPGSVYNAFSLLIQLIFTDHLLCKDILGKKGLLKVDFMELPILSHHIKRCLAPFNKKYI